MRATLLTVALLSLNSIACAGELPDLGTRKKGVDWPRFLGPTGNSLSTETGILTKWPK